MKKSKEELIEEFKELDEAIYVGGYQWKDGRWVELKKPCECITYDSRIKKLKPIKSYKTEIIETNKYNPGKDDCIIYFSKNILSVYDGMHTREAELLRETDLIYSLESCNFKTKYGVYTKSQKIRDANGFLPASLTLGIITIEDFQESKIEEDIIKNKAIIRQVLRISVLNPAQNLIIENHKEIFKEVLNEKEFENVWNKIIIL